LPPCQEGSIRTVLLLLTAAVALAQTDPAYEPLTKAFDALRSRDYDSAIVQFGKAAALSPARADIHKNLAYTLLKTGETDTAREQFGEAVRLDPADLHVALEYAFLCFEARDNAPARKAEARRIFAQVRDSDQVDAEVRATAAQAFRNIDPPLEAGIARWQRVLASSPPTFSAHYELAQLAEQRDALDLAAASYTAAFHLLPERKSVLLELARVEKARGNPEGAMAALLTASRGGEPRAAELAREQLPDRYPYVYEFRNALELDPKNDALHRELAWLLLSMAEKEPARREEARQEFRIIADASPEDYTAAAQLGLLYLADGNTTAAMPILRTVLDHGDPATANHVRMALKMPLVLTSRESAASPLDPRILGDRSYQAGFLKDAKRYFLQAHEENPLDAAIALKLGWTNNMLHDDASAVQWFDIARHSNDPAIAAEAQRAWDNLHPGLELFRTTLWAYPMYSSRWSDLFGYGQVKTELRLKQKKIHPYASVRFVGDARRSTGGVSPQSLSENAFILGAGVASSQWHGATAWFEAGEMFGYLHLTHNQDYRGGLSYARTVGASLASESGGWFFETADDSVFISHFDDDLITSSQNKAGYSHSFGGIETQTFWSGNITFDVKHQYWANFAETGPGFRFRLPAMPKSMSVTLNAVRGAYLVNHGNPRGPNFNDFRAGVWYAFTK
jgi:tetratricopeptide (TPR) repeat protein